MLLLYLYFEYRDITDVKVSIEYLGYIVCEESKQAFNIFDITKNIIYRREE